jgi:hypothetical protein
MGQRDYVKFLCSDKGTLFSSLTSGNITFKCYLQTPELVTLLRHGSPYASAGEFEQDIKSYKAQVNFVLIIEDADPKAEGIVRQAVGSQTAYADFLAYANTNLQNDFELALSNGERVPCALVHVEPANSIKPVIRISGSFKAGDAMSKGFALIFDDNLFSTGQLKFNYSKELFGNLPHLNIEA